MPAAPPPWPTTADFVEAIALAEPERLAVADDAHPASFAVLHAAIESAASRLHAAGVRAGQRVAVGGPGFSAQLAVLFACERLGAITASFDTQHDADAVALFAKVDRVVAAEAVPEAPADRFVQVDAGWFEPTQGLPPAPRTGVADAEPHRIVRTSGSTGAAKFMLLSRAAQEHWIRYLAQLAPYSRETRLWCAGPLVVNAGFTRVAACLRAGGCVLRGADTLLPAGAPTQFWGLPAHAERLLASLPAGWRSPRAVTVDSGGGTLSPTLRQRLIEVLGGPVLNRYGSNESHMICDELDAGGVGLLSPGVDLRIVDEKGHAVAPGDAGRLMLRSPAMAEAYLELPEESAEAFRDGWFRSGDAGRLVGPRRLQLLGRVDDLLDIGGLKMPATRFEGPLRAALPLKDCVVLATNLSGGEATVGIALVLAEPLGRDDVLVRVREALQAESLPALAQVVVLNAVPRLANGKPDRMRLQALLREHPG